ncbi:MAG: phosphoglycerate kinase [Rhodothermales bacterium]
MSYYTPSDLDVDGKRVLIRVDFNVPLREDDAGARKVVDDTRIRAAIPTIQSVIERNGKAILMSHLGRPKGVPNQAFSLSPVALKLEEILGKRVRFASHLSGDAVREVIDRMPSGSVILLENTRFYPGEKKNEDELAEEIASLGDLYINDAFGSAHRAHASTSGVTKFVPTAAMGFLLEREVNYLSKLLNDAERPFVGIIGGAKVSDKIGVIESLLEKVDKLLIGGAMSYTFLKALGHNIGTSLFEEDKLADAKLLFERAEGKILLPSDHIASPEFNNDAAFSVVQGDIPDGLMGLDIGPDSAAAYREILLEAKTIVWNGPMGVFEMPNYAKGTLSVAQALADATEKGAMTVVGGGDSVAAIKQMRFEDKVSHVSTGGGAMLEFLEGKVLPGIDALSEKA